MYPLIGAMLALSALLAAASNPPSAYTSEIHADLIWRHVSPSGRLVLTYAISSKDDRAADDVNNAVLNWGTGRIVGWRRTRLGNVIAWSPHEDLLVRAENGPERPIPLVCRRIPELSEVWRITPRFRIGAWNLDGSQFIVPVGPRDSKHWDLCAIDRSGSRHIVRKDCNLLPWRVILYHGAPVVVCSSAGDKPAPLIYMRLDGSPAGEVGLPLPRGTYIVPRRSDRYAWKGSNDQEFSIVARRGATWTRTWVRIPAAPASTRAYLEESDDSHLMLIRNGDPLAVWSVDWSGRLRKLHLPTGDDQPLPFPWVDGRHLIRTIGDQLELIDGYSGRIVRHITVRAPSR